MRSPNEIILRETTTDAYFTKNTSIKVITQSIKKYLHLILRAWVDTKMEQRTKTVFAYRLYNKSSIYRALTPFELFPLGFLGGIWKLNVVVLAIKLPARNQIFIHEKAHVETTYTSGSELMACVLHIEQLTVFWDDIDTQIVV